MGDWLRPLGSEGQSIMFPAVGTCAHSLGRTVLSLGSRGWAVRRGRVAPQGGGLCQAGLAARPPCRQSRLRDCACSELSPWRYQLVMTPEPPAWGLCFATCKALAQLLSPLVLAKNLAREKRHRARSRETRVQVLANAVSLSLSHLTNVREAFTLYWIQGEVQ